jgi:hypothetical protein
MAKQVAAGKVRVIGGKWRGRRLPLADAAIRPTADRVRETLFNWLDPHLRGANVLDLFAGSGALGFESASRGAANVVLVEKSRGTAEHLRTLVAELDAAEVTVCNEEARRYLASPDRLPGMNLLSFARIWSRAVGCRRPPMFILKWLLTLSFLTCLRSGYCLKTRQLVRFVMHWLVGRHDILRVYWLT